MSLLNTVKLGLWPLILVLATLPSLAQDAAVPAATPSSSEEELRKSFQREYVYLASQKQALTQQKSRLEQGLNQRISVAKSQTSALQKEAVRLTAQNDENHEYMMTLEKRRKDLQKRDSSLESVYKRANQSLATFEAGLRFESNPEKTDVVAPDAIKFDDFAALVTKAETLLTSAASVEAFPSSFLNLDGKLVEGTVTRFGRSAAVGTQGEAHFILGPNGDGLLKALEVSAPPTNPSLSLFVFESLTKMAKIKKPAGFIEKLADLSPILFLGMMLLMVLGLFTALIRV